LQSRDGRWHLFGQKLWVTDGTVGGTRILKSVPTGVYISNLRGSDGKIFFAVGSVSEGGTIPQLWVSNGTTEGTVMVTDFSAPKFAGGGLYPEKLLHFDGESFYFLHYDVFLWKTDGTEAGTEMIKHLGK
jgi:ELWxxDGT repeat protein